MIYMSVAGELWPAELTCLSVLLSEMVWCRVSSYKEVSYGLCCSGRTNWIFCIYPVYTERYKRVLKAEAVFPPAPHRTWGGVFTPMQIHASSGLIYPIWFVWAAMTFCWPQTHVKAKQTDFCMKWTFTCGQSHMYTLVVVRPVFFRQ